MSTTPPAAEANKPAAPTNGADATPVNPAAAAPADSTSRNLLEMRWSQFDRWLRPEYVGDKPFTMTITGITLEDGWLKGKKVRVRSLHFKQTPNMLPLSAINQIALAAIFGNKIGNCIGKDVTLRKTRVMVAKKLQTPLRIQRDTDVANETDDPHYVPLEEDVAAADDDNIAEDIE